METHFPGLTMWEEWTDFLGLAGNIVTGMGYSVRLLLFMHKIYRTRSSETLDVFPRAVDLLIYMIWIFYALLEPEGSFLLTINFIGSVLAIVELIFHLFYGARGQKISTFTLLFWVNVVLFCTILFSTYFSTRGSHRIKVCGWITATATLLSFSIPAYTTWTVIHTHDLDLMPLTPLIFSWLSSITWVVYGAVKKTKVVLIPNVVGGVLTLVQLAVYAYFWVSAPHTPFFDVEGPPPEPALSNSSGSILEFELGGELPESPPPELPPGNELDGDNLQEGCLKDFFIILGVLVFVWYYLVSL